MATNAALLELDDIVRSKLNPDREYVVELKNGAVDGILKEIHRLCDDLRLYLLDNVTQLTTYEAKRVVVAHYCQFAAHLCQRLSNYGERAAEIYSVARQRGYGQVLKEACDEIAVFLSFLQEQYGKMFDEDVIMPFSVLNRSKQAIRKRVSDLEGLSTLPGIDQRLLDIVLRPATNMLPLAATATYREFAYVRTILIRLKALLDNPPADPELEIHKILIAINFNFFEYIEYCQSRIPEKYPAEKFTHDQLLVILRRYIKLQNQVPVEEGMYYTRELKTARELLNNHLEEEIRFVTEQAVLEKGYIGGVKLGDGPPKIRLSLSAAKAAAWLWSGHVAGIFEFESHEEAVKMFCAHFSTVGAENLSATSFRPTYFNIGQSPAGSTMELLHKQREALRKKIV